MLLFAAEVWRKETRSMEAEANRILALLIYGALTLDAPAAEVDAAIVFAVDMSASVDRGTARLQRQGHAEALCAPEVIGAIAQNPVGCIAVTYFEWSGRGRRRSVLPWTTICGMPDGKNAASVILGNSADTGGGTSISFAIDEARLLLDRFEGKAAIKVIDVAGNGRNNDGPSVEESRNRAVDQGYTINAIVLPAYTRGIRYDLSTYFAKNVVGGPNAFVMAPTSVQQFGAALRRKLVREISLSSPVTPSAMAGLHE